MRASKDLSRGLIALSLFLCASVSMTIIIAMAATTGTVVTPTETARTIPTGTATDTVSRTANYVPSSTDTSGTTDTAGTTGITTDTATILPRTETAITPVDATVSNDTPTPTTDGAASVTADAPVTQQVLRLDPTAPSVIEQPTPTTEKVALPVTAPVAKTVEAVSPTQTAATPTTTAVAPVKAAAPAPAPTSISVNKAQTVPITAPPTRTTPTQITAADVEEKLGEVAKAVEEIARDECSALGQGSYAQCKVYILDQYEKRVSCDNLSEAQCRASVTAAYSDAVFYAGQRFEIIKGKLDGLDQGKLSVSALETVLNEGLEGRSITLALKDKNTRVKALRAVESMVLGQDGLISSAPLAVAIDHDNDGIPDDMERRLGTDPEKSDSDGDGFDDAAEILSGFNPKGDGRLQLNLAGIDQALLSDLPIENPIASGSLKASFSIGKLDNAAATGNQSAGLDGYVISGTADPNLVITLYIYSDIPVVTTVTTDAYGNWQYHFDEPLEDGQHEIYVAVNDNTGKVISKGQPLSFLVKDAQAFTIGGAGNGSSSDSDSMINLYILAALFLVVFGILGFFFAVLKQKNKFQS